MLSVCGMVGKYLVDWDSVFWMMMGAAYVTCLNTGLRKCSISTAHPDDLYATLANIAGSWTEIGAEPDRANSRRSRMGT